MTGKGGEGMVLKPLGFEALQRFVRRDPLRRVHECVFGVLALESQLTDSRR
jgi:protein phosphatase